MKILFLTEGGEKIGFGHITRCIALCEALEEKCINPEFPYYVVVDNGGGSWKRGSITIPEGEIPMLRVLKGFPGELLDPIWQANEEWPGPIEMWDGPGPIIEMSFEVCLPGWIALYVTKRHPIPQNCNNGYDESDIYGYLPSWGSLLRWSENGNTYQYHSYRSIDDIHIPIYTCAHPSSLQKDCRDGILHTNTLIIPIDPVGLNFLDGTNQPSCAVDEGVYSVHWDGRQLALNVKNPSLYPPGSIPSPMFPPGVYYLELALYGGPYGPYIPGSNVQPLDFIELGSIEIGYSAGLMASCDKEGKLSPIISAYMESAGVCSVAYAANRDNLGCCFWPPHDICATSFHSLIFIEGHLGFIYNKGDGSFPGAAAYQYIPNDLVFYNSCISFNADIWQQFNYQVYLGWNVCVFNDPADDFANYFFLALSQGASIYDSILTTLNPERAIAPGIGFLIPGSSQTPDTIPSWRGYESLESGPKALLDQKIPNGDFELCGVPDNNP